MQVVPADSIGSCKDEDGKAFSPHLQPLWAKSRLAAHARRQCEVCQRTDLVSGRLARKGQCQGRHKVHRVESADEALLHNFQQRSCCSHLQKLFNILGRTPSSGKSGIRPHVSHAGLKGTIDTLDAVWQLVLGPGTAGKCQDDCGLPARQRLALEASPGRLA